MMTLRKYNWLTGSAENFEKKNPVLKKDQVGMEEDTCLYKIGDGTTAYKDLKYANSTGESASYTDTDGAIVSVGGFSAGDTADNMNFQDFAYKLLHPYTKPTVEISLNPSTLLYDIVSDTITSITLTAKVTKKSNSITKIDFYAGSTKIHTITSGIENGGTFSFKYAPSTPIQKSISFKVVVNDGDNDTQASKSVTFVGATYYGTLANDITNPTEVDIKSLNKTLKNQKGYTYNNISMEYSKICYAIPSSLGALTSIKDANNISYLDSYSKTTVTVDGIEYYVYLLKDVSTVSKFTQIYA